MTITTRRRAAQLRIAAEALDVPDAGRARRTVSLRPCPVPHVLGAIRGTR
ncbi:MAG: hypothetical protein WKF57_12930 [Nakamurella sp.]